VISTRAIIAGDLAALLAFALLGLASHEDGVTVAALARTFLPFAISWLAIGALAGAFRRDSAGRPLVGWRFLAVYLPAATVALLSRAVVFDRSLFSAFFVIALVGNGLFLLAWRFAARIVIARRSTPAYLEEAA
jgi:hypothetical protein